MLANCNAITVKGIKNLLESKTLNKTIKKLYLADVFIAKEMISLLKRFANLDVLILGNIIGIDIFKSSIDKKIWNLSNLQKNNAQVLIFVGELEKWVYFKHT